MAQFCWFNVLHWHKNLNLNLNVYWALAHKKIAAGHLRQPKSANQPFPAQPAKISQHCSFSHPGSFS